MGVYEERFKCSILFCPILTLYSGFILFNGFPLFLSAECLMTKNKADQTVGEICVVNFLMLMTFAVVLRYLSNSERKT